MSHPFSWAAIILGALSVLLVFRGPLKRWGRKVRRRRGGVYLVRCDHHLNRARRVNGYVGETVSHHLRQRQHLGSSRFHPTTGKPSPTPVHRTAPQPWSDLNPVWHKLTLPWWLCWKWVLRPLETLVILCTWPVYNDAKNHWNPRRIPKSIAKAQRNARDAGTIGYRAKVAGQHLAGWAVRAAGVAVILTGLAGWVWTR